MNTEKDPIVKQYQKYVIEECQKNITFILTHPDLFTGTRKILSIENELNAIKEETEIEFEWVPL